MKISCVQFAPVKEDVRANIDKMIELLPSDSDLVIFPELATSGYLFENREEFLKVAEVANGESAKALTKAAKENNCHIVYGLPEIAGDKLYNSASLIGPDGLIYTYQKIHLFNKENDMFDPGDEPWKVLEINGVKIGIMICYDWVLPESARILALSGAEVIAHPSNLVLPFCQDAMITRCLENGVFAATCNRIGDESLGDFKLTYTGKSQVVSPKGDRLIQASIDKEEVITFEIDTNLSLNKMITPKNHLFKQRRTEFYQKLLEKLDD